MVGHTANLEEAVENFPRVELDSVLALEAKAIENLVDDSDLDESLESKERDLIQKPSRWPPEMERNLVCQHTISASGIIGSYTP